MIYKTYNDLIQDSKKLSCRLSRNYAGVISIPRSGNIPANTIGLHRNIPVFTISEFINSIDVTKFTQRLGNGDVTDRYLVIDDSSNTGERITQARNELSQLISSYKFDFACIYVTDGAKDSVDVFQSVVPQPRVFEWNVFNHDIISHSCLDIDGVVCPDPDPRVIDEVRDENAYINYITNALPMNFIKVPIKCFTTSRLEKYRAITEAWLQRNGFQYDKLIMSPHPTAIERRRRNTYAQDKAKAYINENGRLMIESSSTQAKQIFELTKKPVLCTDTNTLYSL